MSAEQPSNIIAEINFPIAGKNRRLGGILARDSEREVTWLLHRGAIGGGKPGVGKLAFLDWYKHQASHEFARVDEGFNVPTRAIPIGQIADDELVQGIYRFVRNVRDFKNQISSTLG